MALCCFLGLRPGEIAALKWEDVDDTHLRIRRNVVKGIVGTLKTLESVRDIPLIDRVKGSAGAVATEGGTIRVDIRQRIRHAGGSAQPYHSRD